MTKKFEIPDIPWELVDDARRIFSYITRLKGKAGMFLGSMGRNRQEAIDGGKKLLDMIQ